MYGVTVSQSRRLMIATGLRIRMLLFNVLLKIINVAMIRKSMKPSCS